MRCLLIALLLAVTAYADVDTKDGRAITEANNQDGLSGTVGKADGQTVKAASGGAGGTVISFDGTDDMITFSGVATSDNTFSVAMWIRPAAFADSWQSLLTEGGLNGFFCRSSALIGFNTAGGSHFGLSTLSPATWYHIAFVNNAGSWTMYINGVSDATGTGATTTGSLNNMGNNAGSDTFNGRIAQCAVFSVAITGTHVANLHNKSTTPTAIGNCLAWWKLDDVANGVSGDAASFVDSSGNGHTGTGSDGANNTGFTGVTADF